MGCLKNDRFEIYPQMFFELSTVFCCANHKFLKFKFIYYYY